MEKDAWLNRNRQGNSINSPKMKVTKVLEYLTSLPLRNSEDIKVIERVVEAFY